MAIVGVDLGSQVIPDPDDLALAFHGENYDEGDRKNSRTCYSRRSRCRSTAW